MVPANFSEAEQEDGTHPPSSLAPLPQTNTLKLANMSLSHKVWALFKGLLLCLGVGCASLHTSPLRDISQFATVLQVSGV